MDNKDFKKQLIARAFHVTKNGMKLVDAFPRKQSARIISDQFLRAITSIGANIVEAQAASSKRDFVNFLNHALKSGNETLFWLELSKDLDESLVLSVDQLSKDVDEITKILGSSIAMLREKL